MMLNPRLEPVSQLHLRWSDEELKEFGLEKLKELLKDLELERKYREKVGRMDFDMLDIVCDHAWDSLLPEFWDEYKKLGSVKKCQSYEEIKDFCKVVNLIYKHAYKLHTQLGFSTCDWYELSTDDEELKPIQFPITPSYLVRSKRFRAKFDALEGYIMMRREFRDTDLKSMSEGIERYKRLIREIEETANKS